MAKPRRKPTKKTKKGKNKPTPHANGNDGKEDGAPTSVDPTVSSPPPPEKQREVVKQLMDQADKQGLQVGEKRYVVAAKWWERWCQFVGYDRDEISDSSPPSKLNNLPLLHVSSDTPLDDLMGGPLRPQLKEQYHYMLLPEEVGDSDLGTAFNRVDVYPELTTENGAVEEETPKGVSQSEVTTPLPKKVVKKQSSGSQIIPKFCAACRRAPASLKRCGNCQLLWYCGTACQTSHWKWHKASCKSSLPDAEKEQAVLAELESERRGKMGLRNVGNTCFMNSALQCLSHVEPLTTYFLSNAFKDDVNRDNVLGTGGHLVDAYEGLMKELYFGRDSYTTPSALKRAVSRFAPRFSGFQQHDAQELLAYLVDGLHEDLNRVEHKPYTETMESDGKTKDVIVADEAWKRHLLRNRSILVDYVQGQFKSTVVCPDCGKVSITFDPYNCIQLELPSQSSRKMEVLFVPASKDKDTTRYIVEVPKKGSMLTLKRAVANKCGVETAADLLVVDVYQSMVYRLVGDMERLVRVRDEDRLVLYEIEEPASYEDEEELSYAFVYHRIDTSTVGDPIMIPLSKKSSCKYLVKQLQAQLQSRVASKAPLDISLEQVATNLRVCDRDGSIVKDEAVPLDDSVSVSEFTQADHSNQTTGLYSTNFLRSNEDLTYLAFSWPQDICMSDAQPRPHMEKIKDDSSVQELRGSTGGKLTLDDCFKKFTQSETLDEANLWYCSNCKDHVPARKTLEVWSLPDVLILSLKRFEYRNEVLRDKLDAYVDFPLEGLDMASYCLEPRRGGKSMEYDLFGVTNHFGSMGFGHYTAFARSWSDNGAYPGWYNFDDASVTPASASQVKTNAAYILFYKRRGLSSAPKAAL